METIVIEYNVEEHGKHFQEFQITSVDEFTTGEELSESNLLKFVINNTVDALNSSDSISDYSLSDWELVEPEEDESIPSKQTISEFVGIEKSTIDEMYLNIVYPQFLLVVCSELDEVYLVMETAEDQWKPLYNFIKNESSPWTSYNHIDDYKLTIMHDL